MSNGKSGYEIRADLLSMAQSILYDNLQRKIDATYNHNDNHPDDKKPIPNKSIDAQEIIAVAAELNEFVIAK
ncbi:MAG: hypothetical protein EBW42_04305 [Rhodobacterales bacterium]|nr:hypothetical protein [Rhodobacterales bacterium]